MSDGCGRWHGSRAGGEDTTEKQIGSTRPSAWPDRRRRRMIAKEAERGRLGHALDRILDLEAEIEKLSAKVVEQDDQEKLRGTVMAAAAIEGRTNHSVELIARLALTAPVLEAKILEAAGHSCIAATPQVVAKRNAANHAFQVPAAALASMEQAELNAVQGGKRRPRSRAAFGRVRTALPEPPRAVKFRRQQALRTPAEKITSTWQVKPARSKSMPSSRIAPVNGQVEELSGPQYKFQVLVEAAFPAHTIKESQSIMTVQKEERATNSAQGKPQQANHMKEGNGRGAPKQEDEDAVLEAALAQARQEHEGRLCGSLEHRQVGKLALQRFLSQSQRTCPEGHPLQVSEHVRGQWCDGPCARPGEATLAIGHCERCQVDVCIGCLSCLRG